MTSVGTHGYAWSATASGSDGLGLWFGAGFVETADDTAYRRHTRAVRCLQAFTSDLVSRMCSHSFHFPPRSCWGGFFVTFVISLVTADNFGRLHEQVRSRPGRLLPGQRQSRLCRWSPVASRRACRALYLDSRLSRQCVGDVADRCRRAVHRGRLSRLCTIRALSPSICARNSTSLRSREQGEGRKEQGF